MERVAHEQQRVYVRFVRLTTTEEVIACLNDFVPSVRKVRVRSPLWTSTN